MSRYIANIFAGVDDGPGLTVALVNAVLRAACVGSTIAFFTSENAASNSILDLGNAI